MSLINEALKKAQRQRTEESGPAVTAAAPATPGTVTAPVARIPKHRPPMPARTLVVLIGGGCSLLVMAGVLVFVFFFNNSEPEPAPHPKPVVAAKPPVAPAPAPEPAPAVTPAASPVVSPAPAPAVASVAPVAAAPEPALGSTAPAVSVKLPPIVASTEPSAPAPAPVVQVATPAPVVEPAPVVAVRPVAPRPAVREPVANTAIYELLEKLRVSGVRASSTDPKVIINDRVYRLNDIVDKNTQLRLIRIESFTLIFSDPSGFEYRKTL